MSRGLSRFLRHVNFIASFANTSGWHENTGTSRAISTYVRWLASTYIRQLRSGLPQCCMHEDILGRDGAILPGGLKQGQVHKQPHIRSRPQVPAWNWGADQPSSIGNNGPAWNQSGFHVAPEGNGQFTGKGHDHDTADPLALPFHTCLEP